MNAVQSGYLSSFCYGVGEAVTRFRILPVALGSFVAAGASYLIGGLAVALLALKISSFVLSLFYVVIGRPFVVEGINTDGDEVCRLMGNVSAVTAGEALLCVCCSLILP